ASRYHQACGLRPPDPQILMQTPRPRSQAARNSSSPRKRLPLCPTPNHNSWSSERVKPQLSMSSVLPRRRIKQALPDKRVDLVPPTLRLVRAAAMEWTGANPPQLDRYRVRTHPALADRSHEPVQPQILQAANDVRARGAAETG